MGSIISRGHRAAGGGEGSSKTARVQVFHSDDQWQLHFNSLKDSPKLMVIDFAASWCPPCRAIEPYVTAMAAKYTDVSFAKIDVDKLKEVAEQFNVTAMPTFVLVKEGKEVDRLVGPGKDKHELEKKIIASSTPETVQARSTFGSLFSCCV